MRWLGGRSCTLPTQVIIPYDTLARCDKAIRIGATHEWDPPSWVCLWTSQSLLSHKFLARLGLQAIDTSLGFIVATDQI
jgi:hypothetical protein